MGLLTRKEQAVLEGSRGKGREGAERLDRFLRARLIVN